MYLIEKCPGNPNFIDKGEKRIKDCSNCTFPHRPENYDKVMAVLREKVF
jgi:Zn-finger protein